MKNRASRLTVITLTLPLLVACGYSEQDWQAQLDKYGKLNQAHQAQQAELDAARADVERLKGEVAELQKYKDRAQALEKLLQDSKEQREMLARIKARFEALRDKLKALTEFGLEVKIRHNKMVISMPGDVLFPSGSAKLSRSGQDVLKKVASALSSDKTLAERYYQVAGHTDNQPVVRTVEEFKDNWGLSVMRAREVLLFVTQSEEGSALDIKRWSAAGYADTDPVAANTTPASRRKNRRVELVVQPDIEEMIDLKSLIEGNGSKAQSSNGG